MNESASSTQHAGVIVTDGNERSALAVTRSLGRRGIPVFVGAETSPSLAGVSRFCRESFVYPAPSVSPDEFRACLLECANRWGTRLIFPMTDLAVEILGQSIQRSGASVILPIPSLDQYHALSNKYQLVASAGRQGVPIPETIFVPDGDVERVIPQISRWPIVIKPGRSLIKGKGRWQKTAVLHAGNADELRRFYWELDYLKEPSLLQARVVGEGQGVFGLFDRGKPVTLFAHRRLRERPPSGGVSVLRESMALREPITEYALRVMRTTEWHGVAMVEFKVDRVSGVPYLMEVNGRFWGSLQLAIDAGVDFPWLLYRLGATGAVPHPTGTYEVGVRSRWWLGDLDHLILRWWRSDSDLDLPPGSPSRWTTLWNFLRVLDRNTKSEVLRLSDLKPGVHELGGYSRSLIRAIGRMISGRLHRLRRGLIAALWDIGLSVGIHHRVLNSKFPRQVRRILVLCQGNICRSPFAERWLYAKASEQSLSLDISSAGLDALPGKGAYPLAAIVSRDHGIDLGRHCTAAVSEELVANADVILVMELAHVRQLRTRFPEARRKTFLLGHFAQAQPLTEIQDPYGGTRDEFARCYSLVAAACEGLLLYLRKQVQSDG